MDSVAILFVMLLFAIVVAFVAVIFAPFVHAELRRRRIHAAQRQLQAAVDELNACTAQRMRQTVRAELRRRLAEPP